MGTHWKLYFGTTDIGQAGDASGEETVHEMEKAGEHRLARPVQGTPEGPGVLDVLGALG